MTIQECYQSLGGDFVSVQQRLPSVNLIRRFITKFLDDGSFAELCHHVDAGDRQEAFRAAHTLKGVCANLGFNRLMSSASSLTELLRSEGTGIPQEAFALLEQVKADYAVTADAIRAYLASETL